MLNMIPQPRCLYKNIMSSILNWCLVSQVAVMERMARNDNNKDDTEDANNPKGTGDGDVDGKDAMPVISMEQG